MLASPYGLPRIVDPRVMQFVQQTDDAKVIYKEKRNDFPDFGPVSGLKI